MKHHPSEYQDFAKRTGSTEPKHPSYALVLTIALIVSIIIADMVTGYQLHYWIAGVMTSGV